jgi:hypothetical protein
VFIASHRVSYPLLSGLQASGLKNRVPPVQAQPLELLQEDTVSFTGSGQQSPAGVTSVGRGGRYSPEAIARMSSKRKLKIEANRDSALKARVKSKQAFEEASRMIPLLMQQLKITSPADLSRVVSKETFELLKKRHVITVTSVNDLQRVSFIVPNSESSKGQQRLGLITARKSKKQKNDNVENKESRTLEKAVQNREMGERYRQKQQLILDLYQALKRFAQPSKTSAREVAEAMLVLSKAKPPESGQDKLRINFLLN